MWVWVLLCLGCRVISVWLLWIVVNCSLFGGLFYVVCRLVCSVVGRVFSVVVYFCYVMCL